jgi:hypothetical protein
MDYKHINIFSLLLAIEMMVAFDGSSGEILFPSTPSRGDVVKNPRSRGNHDSSSTNAEDDIDERYLSQNTDSAIFGDGKTNTYSSNVAGSVGGSGGQYYGYESSGYNPTQSNTEYIPNSQNGNNYRPDNAIGGNGIYYSGGSNNYDGSYNQGNGNPFSDSRPNTPESVGFSAIRANTNTNSGFSKPIQFERTITDVGYGWNSRESYFECYHPGTYVFSWSAVSPTELETRISLFKNGQETGHHSWADRNGYQSASQMAVLNLIRGDRVELRLTEGRLYEPSSSRRGYNTFSGFKLN